jgi:uncharacterized protein YprB with RNaseH-like and TPR domain
MKGAVFDIETTGLDAVGSGTLLCVVIKPLERRHIVFRADEMRCTPGHEKKLVQAANEELAKYDLLVGHYITRFDLPWLRSRALFFGLPEPARPFVYDTCAAFGRLGYKTVPNHFGRPSRNLGHVADFFGIEQEKTGIYPREWWQSVWGDVKTRKKAMDDIVNHCIKDVRMNERAYWLLMRADTSGFVRRAK